MDTTVAALIALAVLVLASIAFFAVFRRRGRANFKGPFGQVTLQGDNVGPSEPIAAGVNAVGAKAGRNLQAASTASEGGVIASGAEAGQDMILTHTPGTRLPKKS